MCLDANQAIAHQKGETRCKIDEICFGSNVRAISIYEEAGEDTGCSFVAPRANVHTAIYTNSAGHFKFPNKCNSSNMILLELDALRK